MLIDTTDPLWPRVAAAFIAGRPVPDGLTADQFAQNRIMELIKGVVRNYESQDALQPAQAVIQAAIAKVDADFDVSFVKPVGK